MRKPSDEKTLIRYNLVGMYLITYMTVILFGEGSIFEELSLRCSQDMKAPVAESTIYLYTA